MPMTIAVTRDVAPRVRGFLASVMVEVAAGVFAAPRLSPQVRGRILTVLETWQADLGSGGFTLLWEDKRIPGGLALRTLGQPARQLVEADGLYLARTPLDAEEARRLIQDGRSLTSKQFATRPAGRPDAPDLAGPR